MPSSAVFIAVGIVAAAIVAGAALIASALARRNETRRPADPLAVIAMFAPGIIAAQSDPRALLVWQPLARMARQLNPELFTSLDRASGGMFPFTAAQIQAAHAQWTTDWLKWERAHDAEFKMKAVALEQDLAAQGSSAMRARLEAVEREKLESYQQRYEEYVRVAKALQALAG